MATHSLQAESAQTQQNEFERLYVAWRYAKALWEAQMYSPEYYASGLPDDVANAHCRATCAALDTFLMHPAETSRELAIKLRVFRDEEIEDGYVRASEVVATIADDAQRIAFG